ncbi:hypothetical protein [uncultured Clostridium sp.]|nr:hypothetical protein [uncultured Clostridium sp.]
MEQVQISLELLNKIINQLKVSQGFCFDSETDEVIKDLEILHKNI